MGTSPGSRAACAVAGPIVTSQGQADSGLFEVQLRDERYLPFEGRGAVESRWRVELPAEFRAFDYTAISDLVLHLRYTARDGGTAFRSGVTTALSARLQSAAVDAVDASAAVSLTRVIPLRNEGASEWVHLVRSEPHSIRHPRGPEPPTRADHRAMLEPGLRPRLGLRRRERRLVSPEHPRDLADQLPEAMHAGLLSPDDQRPRDLAEQGPLADAIDRRRQTLHRPRPERWLDRAKKPGALETAQFGGGPHFCLGYHVAWLEAVLFLVCVTLTRRYLGPVCPRPRTIRSRCC